MFFFNNWGTLKIQIEVILRTYKASNVQTTKPFNHKQHDEEHRRPVFTVTSALKILKEMRLFLIISDHICVQTIKSFCSGQSEWIKRNELTQRELMKKFTKSFCDEDITAECSACLTASHRSILLDSLCASQLEAFFNFLHDFWTSFYINIQSHMTLNDGRSCFFFFLLLLQGEKKHFYDFDWMFLMSDSLNLSF